MWLAGWIEALPDFGGRLHPLIVHLPIGLLLPAAILHFLPAGKWTEAAKPALPLLYAAGALSAIAACATGLLLRPQADYSSPLIDRHLWSGIAVAVCAAVLAWLGFYRPGAKKATLHLLNGALAVLLMLAGHLGGSLTHGAGYLTAAFSGPGEVKPALAPIAQVQEAEVYNDLVGPLLQKRCVHCHSPQKTKGGLQLHLPEAIAKGGENGAVLLAGQPGNSKLIQRLLLPHDDKKHMPPIQEAQLTETEIQLLHWWVAQGATYTGKVKSLPQGTDMQAVWAALQSGKHATGADKVNTTGIPTGEATMPDAKLIESLKQSGVSVLPLAQGSPWLAVHLLHADTALTGTFEKMKPLAANIAHLHTGGKKLTAAHWQVVGQCTNLTRMHATGSALPTEALKALASLPQLQWLNLSGSTLPPTGVEMLGTISSLRNLYLYGTALPAAQFTRIKQQLSTCRIDTGGYQLPKLASDTMVVKW
jgi:uncharacterized membrane protein